MTEKTPVPAEGTAPEAVVGLATDGAYYLVVAQFPTVYEAQAVYAELQQIERTTRLRIDGVVIHGAECVSKTFPEFFEVFEPVTSRVGELGHLD